jgi:hypothetical protein
MSAPKTIEIKVSKQQKEILERLLCLVILSTVAS